MRLSLRGFDIVKCRNCKKEVEWDFDKNYCEMCYPDYDYYTEDIHI